MSLGKSWIWYAAGLVLAVLAGVIAVLALRQAVPAAQPARTATRPIIVARKDLAGRQMVSLDSLETREIPLEEIPSGAIFRMEDAAGKFLLPDVKAGQPLLAQNLVAPPSATGAGITTTTSLAALLPTDKVAVVLPAGDLLSQSGDLNLGDKIDILASIMVPGAEKQPGTGGQVTLMNLQNVPIVKVLQEVTSSGGGTGTQQQPQRIKIIGLVLAVDPQDGIILKYFIDSGAKVSIDLRSPRLTMAFDVTPVSLEYLADKYKIKVPKPLEVR